MIANALLEFNSSAFFTVNQDPFQAFNSLTNASIPATQQAPLQYFYGQPVSNTNFSMLNHTRFLSPLQGNTTQTLSNGNYTFIVVINNSTTQRLGFSVAFSQAGFLTVSSCLFSLFVLAST